MSYLLGLTGSIGMGKSTTAALFADRGCLVWDADSTVHHAYGPKGVAVGAIAKIAASAVGSNGVNRDQLRQLISKDPALLLQIEAIIHPIVQQDRQYFIASNPNLISKLERSPSMSKTALTPTEPISGISSDRPGIGISIAFPAVKPANSCLIPNLVSEM